MNVSYEEYGKMYKSSSPASPKIKDFVCAFLIGGGICAFAEALSEVYISLKMPEEQAKALVSVTLIFISALLTACHVFDDIARVAGAGTLVPITGFANAVVSPAIEYKTEGHILGTGARLFSVAGPVLTYGIAASVLYGIALYIISIL